jgi:hypothetical protein
MEYLRTLLALLLLGIPLQLHASVSGQKEPGQDSSAQTYTLTTIAVLRNAPEGRIVDIWNSDTRFTSNVADGKWIRVTGYFPDNQWQPNSRPLWIDSHYVSSFQPKISPRSTRPAGIIRYIEVDKDSFELKVIEERKGRKSVIFKTVVGLGMDRCLPKAKGGRCYYTEPGEYQVRWKVHDPEGIEWCIPESMEQEYRKALARGERCYRGAIGSYALNIGKSYAIHGTSNPRSLGKKISHGCIRTANSDMKRLYSLMDVGDKVFIVDRGSPP